MGVKARNHDPDPIRGSHQGQRHLPHKQAGRQIPLAIRASSTHDPFSPSVRGPVATQYGPENVHAANVEHGRLGYPGAVSRGVQSAFRQRSSVPAASAVVPTAEDEDNKEDDQKGCQVHGRLLRICRNQRRVIADPDVERRSRQDVPFGLSWPADQA